MKKGIASLLFAIAITILLPEGLFATVVNIQSPRGGYTTSRIQSVHGTVQDFSGQMGTMIVNGVEQNLRINSGRFSVNVVVAPGENLIEVRAGNASDRVFFYAKVPPRDIKIVLTWDPATDVDLWVIDPSGERCYYGSPQTKAGGNLDVDITSGYGPETFTMTRALPGNYAIQVQYFSSRGAPVTRVKVTIVLNEGTDEEKRIEKKFVMTKEHQLYQIAEFSMDGSVK